MKASDLFSLPVSLERFAAFFPPDAAPWDWVKAIGRALGSLDPAQATPRSALPPGVHVEGPVWIDPSVLLPSYATLIGPIFVGPRTEIRPGAYLRGNVIVGADGCVGHGAEVKNALLLDRVQAPHRPYVGDSVLGNRAHLAAGVVLSNLRLDQAEVVVRSESAAFPTGLRKLGALLGDGAEVGCNAVLNPGCVLGRRAVVLPAMAFGGVLPEATIARVRQTVTTVARRD